MRNRIGRESESKGTTATRSLGLLVVASLAVLFALRAGWLASQTPPSDIPSQAKSPPSAFPLPPSSQSLPPSQGRLSAKDYALLSTVCPTAIDTLPAELLPLEPRGKGEDGRGKAEGGRGIPTGTASAEKLVPPHRLTAAHSPTKQGSTARITGVRVATRPDWSRRPERLAQADTPFAEPADDDGWLISPEAWYVPEDHAKSKEQEQPAMEEPSADLADVPATAAPIVEPGPAVPPQEKTTQEEAPPAHDWPILPPKPTRSPEGTPPPKPSTEAPAEELAPRTQESPQGLAPAEREPIESESPGPLLTEPDFIVEQQEPTPSEDAIAPEEKKTPPASIQEGPLFAAPPIDSAPVDSPTVDSPPVRSEPPVQAPSPAPEPTPQSENLPAPELPLPVAKEPVAKEPASKEVEEPPKEIVPVPINAAPEPQAIAPLPSSAPAQLFAPPAPSSQAVSVHGAGAAAAARKAAGGKSADQSHAELFSQNCYPSAKDCAKCHEKIYDEWSLSAHAYAYVSPMFHRFEQTINDLSQGTVGTFCLRCHSPAGISMAPAVGHTRTTPIAETSTASRDGVGCISCHRVNERYGKVNGERRVVTGDLFDPVYGGLGGDGVAAAIAEKTKYKLKTSAAEKGPGQAIHNEGRFFDQLSRSEACASCHQVAVHPGIKLEVVWEQYRASPACEKGVSCQDCHMGRVPGVPSGYNYGPIAEVAGKTVRTDRKQSNHSFYGPGYSIAHPGVFPQHPKSDRWTIDEWMLFDWRAGWGTEEFEDRMADAEEAGQNIAAVFPPVWREEDDRYDARDIIEDNLEKLKIKRRQRELVMENGSSVDGPFFRDPPTAGQDLKFEYIVTNLNEGHNLPTASLGAQPQLWANVVLIGPDGRRVWESGYTDSQGDLCDIHSEDVQKGRAPYDSQLFNLQTMFMITGATGTDREFYLPVNLSIDQVAHLRPGALPISVLNHPPFIRMESRSIGPLGKKRAKYRVPAEVMCQPGHYRLSFRMRSRLEPMYFMRFVGATEEMQRAMSEGILDVHPMSVEFEVKAPQQTARQPATNGGWMR